MTRADLERGLIVESLASIDSAGPIESAAAPAVEPDLSAAFAYFPHLPPIAPQLEMPQTMAPAGPRKSIFNRSPPAGNLTILGGEARGIVDGEEGILGRVRAHNLPHPAGTRKKPTRAKRPPNVEQKPAAYRFKAEGEKIDVLPELPQPIDREFALDTLQELLAKARALHDGLERSNSPRRVCGSIQGLVEALDVNFNDLRPGVLLSRIRSVEADRTAFDTKEGHDELFADAFAMMDDALQTARDLLAAFPIVRRIEVEQLALALDRTPDAVSALQRQAEEIKEAAAKSGAATEGAINALGQNDRAIRAATDPILKRSLVADTLLVVANFARAVAGKAWSELSELGAASWEAVKTELPKGVGVAARIGPLMALTVWIAGPLGGIAAGAPALKPLAGVFKKLAGNKLPKDPRQNDNGGEQKQAINRLELEDKILREAHSRGFKFLKRVHINNIDKYGKWKIFSWDSELRGPVTTINQDLSLKIIREVQKDLNKRFILQQDSDWLSKPNGKDD